MVKRIIPAATPNLAQPLSPEIIGVAVRAKRTQSGLRLEDAAALCGVAKQTLMNVEHGHPKTQLATVLQICAALGIYITIAPWQIEQEDSNEWQ